MKLLKNEEASRERICISVIYSSNGPASIGLNDLWQTFHFSSKKYIKERRSFLFYIVKYSFTIIYLRCLIWIQLARFVFLFISCISYL